MQQNKQTLRGKFVAGREKKSQRIVKPGAEWSAEEIARGGISARATAGDYYETCNDWKYWSIDVLCLVKNVRGPNRRKGSVVEAPL